MKATATFWIVSTIAVVVLIYIWIRIVKSKIDYEVDLELPNRSDVDLSSLLSLTGSIDAKLILKVVNQNPFSITIKDLKGYASYKGNKIAETNGESMIVLSSKGQTTIKEDVKIQINQDIISLLGAKALNDEKNAEITYSVSFSLPFWPFGLTSTGTYNLVTKKTT